MAEYVDTVQSTRRRRRPAPFARSEERPLIARLDWVLLAAAGGLVVFGLWAISGITRHDVPGEPDYYLTRQLVFAGVGVVLMVGAIFIDPAWYRRWKPALYGVMIGLMVLVALVGTVARGSRRWIDVSASSASSRPSSGSSCSSSSWLPSSPTAGRRIEDVRTPCWRSRWRCRPCCSSSSSPTSAAGSSIWPRSAPASSWPASAGSTWPCSAALALVAVSRAVAPARRGVEVLKPYQADRLTGFLDPDERPAAARRTTRQSITAVGAGGFSGRGVDEATQTRSTTCPSTRPTSRSRRSPSSAASSAPVLLLLYLLVVWRGLKIVTLARDAFSAIAAAGIVFALLFQIFVNIGMATGVAPVTGITLAVRERRRLLARGEPRCDRRAGGDRRPRTALAPLQETPGSEDALHGAHGVQRPCEADER